MEKSIRFQLRNIIFQVLNTKYETWAHLKLRRLFHKRLLICAIYISMKMAVLFFRRKIVPVSKKSGCLSRDIFQKFPVKEAGFSFSYVGYLWNRPFSFYCVWQNEGLADVMKNYTKYFYVPFVVFFSSSQKSLSRLILLYNKWYDENPLFCIEGGEFWMG